MWGLECAGLSQIKFFEINFPGKTTILYQLKMGQIITAIPTIGNEYLPIIGNSKATGFNVEKVTFKV